MTSRHLVLNIDFPGEHIEAGELRVLFSPCNAASAKTLRVDDGG